MLKKHGEQYHWRNTQTNEYSTPTYELTFKGGVVCLKPSTAISNEYIEVSLDESDVKFRFTERKDYIFIDCILYQVFYELMNKYKTKERRKEYE